LNTKDTKLVLVPLDGVVSLSNRLTDELALAEPAATIDDDKICRLGGVAVCELIEFHVPTNELLHTLHSTSTRKELSILEITISEI